jgi:hypothetical protein
MYSVGMTHSLGGEGVGGHYLKDARHCSALYIRKYFVVFAQSGSYMDYKVQKARGSRLLRQLQEKYGLNVKKPAFHGYQIIFNKCG